MMLCLCRPKTGGWFRPTLALDRSTFPVPRGSALRWLGGAALALAIGILPWPRLEEGWSRAFVARANGTMLGHAEFGAGAQAQLRPARPEERGKGENVTTDAVLVLAVKGPRQTDSSCRFVSVCCCRFGPCFTVGTGRILLGRQTPRPR
jgi:hypothetical protein